MDIVPIVVFDKTRSGAVRRGRDDGPSRAQGGEDARIALRCDRRELDLVDSLVASGEFSTRSELIRAALHAFVRSRAQSTTPTPRVDSDGLVPTVVRLRPDEYATFVAYARTVCNGRPVEDVLAEVIRRGEIELKVHELAARARSTVQEAVESRAQVGALQESASDLERRGVVGR
ncbi:MAG: ribbon-helix-helix domain-containing protein [Thermoplasmata archaeon]